MDAVDSMPAISFQPISEEYFAFYIMHRGRTSNYIYMDKK